MRKRRIGHSTLLAAPLAFGGNVFGWTVDEQTSFKLLDAFVAAGFNLIDTADVYSRWVPGNSGGESETIIGKWLKRTGKRSEVIMATKVGKEMGPGMQGLSKSYILRAVEDSLRRLQTDYIDLYQSHADDAATPFKETFDAYEQLIGQGKIRAMGASNFSAERLSQAMLVGRQWGYQGYRCLQPLYNLYDRKEFETELEPVCRENGLGVITYFSLASGFLTGKYRSVNDLAKSSRSGFVKKYLDDRGFRILRALDQVSRQHNSTPAAVSLAWLLSRPGITATIASATNLEQLDALISATRLVLDPVSIELLKQASSY
jgi:aryl-alcohol dehydrogenase-like predicted oxidoreductase